MVQRRQGKGGADRLFEGALAELGGVDAVLRSAALGLLPEMALAAYVLSALEEGDTAEALAGRLPLGVDEVERIARAPIEAGLDLLGGRPPGADSDRLEAGAALLRYVQERSGN